MFGDYDEDLNDSKQRCVHGTFIGSWWGPDYICGLCEEGLTVPSTVKVASYSVQIDTLEGNSTVMVAISAEEADRLARFYGELLPLATVKPVMLESDRIVWSAPVDPYSDDDEDENFL